MVIDARLKSLFIFPAVGVTVVLFFASVYGAVFGGTETTAWIGAAVASLPLPIIAAYLVYSGTERTSENLPLALLVAADGVLVATWQQFIEGASGWGPTGVASASAILLLMYVFWYSRFGRFDSAQLMVGSKLPEFTLRDIDGTGFESASLLGSPAVILFYRGNWCPICMAQIRELAGRSDDMEALGITVCLVSPQPGEMTRELADDHDVPFRFLIDEGNAVAEQLNIAVKNGVPAGLRGGYPPDTVMPTLVMTNHKGTILFSDQTDNYRVRPEPDVFLAILRRTGVVAK